MNSVEDGSNIFPLCTTEEPCRTYGSFQVLRCQSQDSPPMFVIFAKITKCFFQFEDFLPEQSLYLSALAALMNSKYSVTLKAEEETIHQPSSAKERLASRREAGEEFAPTGWVDSEESKTSNLVASATIFLGPIALESLIPIIVAQVLPVP
ncbi:hypothetical protein HispidOSU_003923 [Sigmodon hispidus]